MASRAAPAQVITRRFPSRSPLEGKWHERVHWQCEGCTYMTFVMREAYEHHVKTGHWLEEREEVKA